MSLRDDINAALVSMSKTTAPSPLNIDEAGRCTISVPMPASIIELDEGLLNVNIEISRTGRFFTLSSPIAYVSQKTGKEFFRALFYRQFYADQVQGASFAIGGREDLLVAVYHWMLDSITQDDFTTLFKGFVSASFDLIDEVGEMARREHGVKPLHKGRPK